MDVGPRLTTASGSIAPRACRFVPKIKPGNEQPRSPRMWFKALSLFSPVSAGPPERPARLICVAQTVWYLLTAAIRLHGINRFRLAYSILTACIGVSPLTVHSYCVLRIQSSLRIVYSTLSLSLSLSLSTQARGTASLHQLTLLHHPTRPPARHEPASTLSRPSLQYSGLCVRIPAELIQRESSFIYRYVLASSRRAYVRPDVTREAPCIARRRSFPPARGGGAPAESSAVRRRL